MASTECNGGFPPAGWRSRSGRLLFPTVAGVVSVDPTRDTPVPPPPAVVLEGITVDHRGVAVAADVVLPPGRGDLQFAYTAPTFRVARDLVFRYRLDGYDNDWVEAGTRREAFYTNVPPGQYAFRIEASNARGAWSADTVVALTIEPRFYQAEWFRGLATLAVIALAASAYAARTRQLRRQAIVLQQRVDDAVAKINLLHGLLPICAGCKKIRNDVGSWQQVEVYIRDHADVQFSHGLCPDCLTKLYPTQTQPH